MLRRVLWVQFVVGRYFHITSALKPQSVFNLLKLWEDHNVIQAVIGVGISATTFSTGGQISYCWYLGKIFLGMVVCYRLVLLQSLQTIDANWDFLSIPTLIDPGRGPELGHISGISGTQLLWRHGPKWLKITAHIDWHRVEPMFWVGIRRTSNAFNSTSLACWDHSAVCCKNVLTTLRLASSLTLELELVVLDGLA